jgi:hypothetical protein
MGHLVRSDPAVNRGMLVATIAEGKRTPRLQRQPAATPTAQRSPATTPQFPVVHSVTTTCDAAHRIPPRGPVPNTHPAAEWIPHNNASLFSRIARNDRPAAAIIVPPEMDGALLTVWGQSGDLDRGYVRSLVPWKSIPGKRGNHAITMHEHIRVEHMVADFSYNPPSRPAFADRPFKLPATMNGVLDMYSRGTAENPPLQRLPRVSVRINAIRTCD